MVDYYKKRLRMLRILTKITCFCELFQWMVHCDFGVDIAGVIEGDACVRLMSVMTSFKGCIKRRLLLRTQISLLNDAIGRSGLHR
ncbi:unnamed protein product [Rhizophagus irregularis]|nr:unnamed protein product [Rhizophagus irregularis]CAB5210259.1 unnamed protein product [Rhizophagus irregularis]